MYLFESDSVLGTALRASRCRFVQPQGTMVENVCLHFDPIRANVKGQRWNRVTSTLTLHSVTSLPTGTNSESRTVLVTVATISTTRKRDMSDATDDYLAVSRAHEHVCTVCTRPLSAAAAIAVRTNTWHACFLRISIMC